jgi:hypothetical protein
MSDVFVPQKARKALIFLVKKTRKTPISVCKCFQLFYDARHIFLLVSKLPDKNIYLTS